MMVVERRRIEGVGVVFVFIASLEGESTAARPVLLLWRASMRRPCVALRER